MRRSAALASALAFALAGGGALAQTAPATRSTSWLQRRLETGLAEALGGTVRIGRIDVDWTNLAATVGDVAISIPAEGAPPLTATVGEARVKLAWSGLSGIAGGQVHLTEVVARRATFSCSREWIDSFAPKRRTGGEPVTVQIDRLIVDDATAEYLDGGQRVRVQASAMNFRGDWSSSRRQLVGEVHASATVEAPLFDHPWPGTVRGGLRLGGGRLEIFGATGEGPGAQGELAGNVTWGVGVSFTAQGRLNADLAALSPYVVGELPLAGKAEGPVQIVYTGGVPIRVTMQAGTTGFRIGPIETDTAHADLTIRPGRLDAAAIDARAYGGAFAGTVGLTFGPTLNLETDLSGKGADLSRLLRLAGKELPIASAADVTFKIVGEPGRPATWSGGGTFDATPVAAGAGSRIPAGGRGRLTFEPGRVRVDAETLALAGASLRFDFESDLGTTLRATRLTLGGTTRDARATQRAALSFLDAFGVKRNRFAVLPVEGTGRFGAGVRTGRTTEFELGIDLTDGSLAGEPFASAVLDLAVSDAGVAIHRLDLSGDGQSLTGSARFDGTTGEVDEVQLAAREVVLSRVLALAGIGAGVDGRVDLDLTGARVGGVFAAQGNVSAKDVIVGREIVDAIDAPVRIEGDQVILDGLVARGHGFEAHARVTYAIDTTRTDVEVGSATIDLASNRTLAEAGLTAKGTIRTEGSVSVDREGPSGLLRVVASDLLLDTGRSGLREIRLGDFDGTGTIIPRGLELAVKSLPDRAWTFEGFLGFAPELPLSAVLYFEDLVAGAGGAFGESADLRLKGQVQAEGDLTELRAMEINGALDEVAVRIGPTVLKAAEPFPFHLESGRFVLGPTRFTGETAGLEVAGSGSIEGGGVAGYLKGTVDLAIVSSLWSEVRGGGPVEIDATLSGTLDAPDLAGRVAVHGGRLRLIGYPQSLESIDAEAVFERQTLTLSSFHAFQGGGEVEASGRVEFRGIVPAAFHATFNGANVTATFPEGFKGTYEGRITADGTPQRATIAGRVEVVRGLYTKDLDIGLFGGARREFDADSESPFPRNIFLDMDFVAPGNVWLRNDVAKVEASGQLHIGGELARPEVTGRFSLVPGGTVRYRDVDYHIDYGTVDLTDPKRLNPYVDFRGRTRVAQYEIGLHVEGTLDKFDYELTSTPPLASQDIISLLVTGKTLDSLTGSAAAALPADMAAYYFAGLLSSTFGRQIQNSLGIDQLEITPLFLKGTSDPTARVTVGKQVGEAVKIIFSQDIGTAQKQTYQVAWDASRQVRLIAESDTEAGVGGELQYARQFGGTPIGSREDGITARVASVEVRSDDGTLRADLVKRAKIRVGDPFERGRMLQGGDRIRAALVKNGFLQAVVRAEAVLDPGPPEANRIVYRIVQGPRIKVELVVDGGRGKRSLRKALTEFWSETPYTPEFWDEAVHALIDKLQEDGHYAADVTWHAEDKPAGRTVRILVDRGKPVRLRAVRFTGAESIPLERIERQMTSMKSQGIRKRRRLRPSVLAADLAAVRALYREEGFTRVRIEPPQIALSAKGDSAEVDVTIREGPRFTVGDVTFSTDVAAVSDQVLRADAPLRTGETFSPRRLAETEASLKDRFDARGYPDVSVESRVALADGRADIAFDIAAGERKTVALITIEGHRVTKKRTIAQALTFGQGDFLSTQSLLKSQQQLYRTGLFSRVKLTFSPAVPGEATAQTVTVHVEEAPPLALGLGLGYDSEDGPRASFLLGYSNLGGRNVAIALQGRFSAKENQEVLTLRRRHVFGDTIDTLASLLFEKTAEEAFSATRRALSIRLEQRPKARWIRFLRYSIQEVRISDVTDLEVIFKDKLSSLRLADVGLGFVRDTRDDAFLPSRGGYGSIEGSVFAKPLASQASFAKLFLRGSWTVSLNRGMRFALFVRVGAEQPFAGTALVPLSERFFAGGSNTLRGFSTDSVGGLRLLGFNWGGEALFVLNEEFHFPIWRGLRGELFLDAGNVYPTLGDFDPTDLRSSAGLGLRLDTPIGPIRVEYGWKLDRRPDESPGALIFAIGLLF